MVTVCPRASRFGYQTPGFSLGVGAAVIEVRSQLCIGRIGGEDISDDHHEGVGNGDGCFLLRCWVAVATETQHEAVVVGAEPAVGAHRRPGRFNEKGCEVLVALAWGGVFAFARRFVVSGTQSKSRRPSARHWRKTRPDSSRFQTGSLPRLLVRSRGSSPAGPGGGQKGSSCAPPARRAGDHVLEMIDVFQM
jgi:hypothetical protein